MIVRSGEDAMVVLTLTAEPEEARWWVEDQTGGVVLEESAVPGSALEGDEATLSIPGANNTLASNAYRGLRLVRLRYRAPDSFAGWREVEFAYDVIGLDGELVVQKNSFVTYNEALLLAREMTETESFDAASREARVATLAEAWRTLVRLNYDLPDDYDRIMSRVTDFPGADPGDIADMTAEEFLALDPLFVMAIKRAQVAETVERLGGRSVADARAKGLLSSSIGEVSQMYRSGRPIDVGVSPRALKELRGYVVYTPRLSRA
jgi:hypothetical protein